MNDIRNLAPQALWKHFYSLTRIPRPSGLKEPIGNFLVEFGKSLGLETLQDETGNVLVRKPATPGMEDRKAVILQAHMDMVPQKNTGVKHDFKTDPIETIIDGEWVRAQNTTLGADNGIGVAAPWLCSNQRTFRILPLKCLLRWMKKRHVRCFRLATQLPAGRYFNQYGF